MTCSWTLKTSIASCLLCGVANLVVLTSDGEDLADPATGHHHAVSPRGGRASPVASDVGRVTLVLRVVLHDPAHRLLLVARNCVNSCLLYTSDAADEEDSVDLGGRRII